MSMTLSRSEQQDLPMQWIKSWTW